MKQPAIHIMANKRNGTLCTGVTSNLVQRVFQHKNGITRGFTYPYECKRLVSYKMIGDTESANFQEIHIKAGSRKQKLKLIRSINFE